MIFLFPNGQLGNQLLLLVATSSFARKNEHVFLINFNASLGFFANHPNFHYIGCGANYSILKRLLARLILFIYHSPVCSKLFISRITENDSGGISSSLPTLKPPLITAVSDCYFQNECFLQVPRQSVFSISPSFLSLAQEWLKMRHILDNFKIFVHLRRGDYLSWTPFDNGDICILPDSYYLSSLQALLRMTPDAVIVVSSDDSEYAHDLFSSHARTYFVDESPPLSLSILAMCDSGVLSPSSFSFMAAYLSSSLTFTHRNTYLAPRFWLGHSISSWYPPLFRAKFIEYIDA